jgi:hypothetical protein
MDNQREEDVVRGSGTNAVVDILLKQKQQPLKTSLSVLDQILSGSMVQYKCGTSSWYPARVIEVNREKDSAEFGSARLRRVGFTKQNDIYVPCTSRIQPQIVMRETAGSFCKVVIEGRVTGSTVGSPPPS